MKNETSNINKYIYILYQPIPLYKKCQTMADNLRYLYESLQNIKLRGIYFIEIKPSSKTFHIKNIC